MYDQKCEDLARYFLGAAALKSHVRELAQTFQDSAEDFYEAIRNLEQTEAQTGTPDENISIFTDPEIIRQPNVIEE